MTVPIKHFLPQREVCVLVGCHGPSVLTRQNPVFLDPGVLETRTRELLPQTMVSLLVPCHFHQPCSLTASPTLCLKPDELHPCSISRARNIVVVRFVPAANQQQPAWGVTQEWRGG